MHVYEQSETTPLLQKQEIIDGQLDEFHCHSDEDDPRSSWEARKTLMIATVFCLLFMVAEVVGGLLAGSLAILTDAAHLLTDVASFLISLFALFIASRQPTRRMNYGWHRAEVLGATLSVLLIWVVTGALVYIAVERIINEDYEINAMIMLITASVGVFVNIVMGIILHKGGHNHSHGGTPSSVNINVKAAFIHVLGDLVQSCGVFIAALIIYCRPEAKIADPICTFIFSALVLFTTITVLRDAINVLMEGSPRRINFLEVMKHLEAIDGVIKVHDLRIWALTMDKVAVSVHLAVENSELHQDILRAAATSLRDTYDIYHTTIQIETYSRSMQECVKCEHPAK